MIACVYCGGEHALPADVKRCWAEGPVSEPPVPAAPVPRRSTTPVEIHVRRGPEALGRSVVVLPGSPPPDEWADSPRLTVDASTIAEPAPAVDRLRAAAGGGGLTIELEPGVLEPEPTATETEIRPPYAVGPGHRFGVDELRHLVWANAIDVRDEPRWPPLERALDLGASIAADGVGDVVLPGGERAWIDGGPVRFVGPIDGVVVLPTVSIEHDSLTPPGSNDTDADLAPDQLAAVTHQAAAARIIAPAGSGKTRVLTERARHLIGRWHVPPAAITLVAFNKRAQEEMRDRTSDLPGLQVRTLNSIALAVANGTPPFAPQPVTRRTIDEPGVRRVLQRFVSTRRRRNTDPIAPWIDALGAVRLGLADPAVVEPRYGGDVDGLADVFPQYVDALERDGSLDFDGQIDRALRVLLADPAARATAQRSCRVLLVDEFQDLAPAHLLLIRLLAGPGNGVFAVGDDDQTIYGYQGADPGWLIDFERWFPGAGDHPLEVNYRCPAPIVEVADRLLRHNRRRVDKTIRAHDATTGGGWSALVDQADQVGATVTAVREALASGASPSDVAVLTRVNATLAPAQLGLGAADIPVRGGVGTDFVERTAVRAALAWLGLASGRRFDPSDLHEALRRPSRSVHPRIGEWVGEQGDVAGLRRLAERVTNERDAARIGEFADDVERLAGLRESSDRLGPVLDELIDGIGLGGSVATLDDHRRGMNRASQGDDLVALRQLAALYDAASSSSPFERWVRDGLAVPRDPNGVTLATVHRVKGQEWPHVVVHLADAEQFPHRLAEDREEERRLFHVAITRARRSVTIVAGDRPSPFVAELTTEPPDVLPEPPPEPRRAAPARGTGGRPDHPLLDRDRVIAVPGLVLVDQGQEWIITGLEPEAAVAERGDATRRFPIGAKVETAGRQRGALGPRPGEVGEASARLFDRLRSFRDRARNGKPAYTVFDDKTLAAIASALPADLDELARVKGVGPAKLEQYGDDVLELVATSSADA